MHRRVRLDGAERRHAHGARQADAREVVAREVDDHDVLGAVLGVRREVGRERRVEQRVVVARPRALDRPRLAAAVGADAQERLGRRAHELPAAGVEVEVVRHRRGLAQPRVQI